MKTLDFNNFGLSFKEVQKQETLKERQRLLSMGMQEITENELLQELEKLNYKIDKSMCHSYYNTGNEQHYLATSISYMDKKTKQSWAHFEQAFSNHENQAKLQKIRMNNFCFVNGRIWDL